MKNILRCIVGSEFGFGGEGNEQWYYFLALVINCMLTWWLKPELGIVFTIAAIAHYITVFVYGYEMLMDCSVWYSVIYYTIHAVILIVCMTVDWKWTILTSLIVIVAYNLAPDCTGNNIFLRPPKKYVIYSGPENTAPIFVFHTLLFVTFVVIALKLPIALWIRFVIIGACMILHPVIDILEGECVLISDITRYSFEKILENVTNHKDSEYN